MSGSIKTFRIIMVAVLASISILSASDITIKNIQDILNGSEFTQVGGGLIQNMQVAPFNNDLVSFEVTYDKDPTVKLFLFNLKTKNIFQVESEAYAGGTSKSKRRYYLKDKGLQWHPYKNWFVFYGNGMGNRDQMYICRVVVPELINNFAVNGYRIRLDENTKLEKSKLIDPTFDMTGDRIVFSRKVQKRDKKAKYNRSYNLCMVKDIFNYKDLKFKKVEFETILDKRYDQYSASCSPSDKDIVAFISYKNQERKGEDFYAEYSLSILNVSTSEVATVDNMDGYSHYPFKWSNTGNQLFYFKALSLLRTPQKFIDDKINQVNLHFARIEKKGNKISVFLQTNPKTDILLEDVVINKNSVGIINDNNIFAGKYEGNIPTMYLVDINQWRSIEKNYAKRIEFNRDFDTDFPVLLNNELYFVSTVYTKTKIISSITMSEIDLKLTAGESQDVAGVKSEMDSDEYSDDGDYEEYTDDELFDDYEEIEETVVLDTKPDNSAKIQELEKKISELETSISKIDNSIASGMIVIEENDNNIRSFTRQSNDLLDKKNEILEDINSLREQQTQKLKGEREIAVKQTEITKQKNDLLRIDNEILELEKVIFTEKDNIGALESTTAENNAQIAKLNTNISNLKIEKTKTLQTENKLASFQTQLKELQDKNLKLQNDVDSFEKQLASDKNELTVLEKQYQEKSKQLTDVSADIEKLLAAKSQSEQKDKESQIKSRESQLSGLRNDLKNIESDIVDLNKNSDEENKNVTDMTKKIKELNDSKTAILSEITNLKTKKSEMAAKAAEEKKLEEKKAEEKKVKETVAEKDEYEDEYEDEDTYEDDSEISDDIFEEIETQSSGRRGRR